jgi:hypothetical protein
MKKTIKLPAEVSPAMFMAWKKKHGKLLVVSTVCETDTEISIEGDDIVIEEKTESEKSISKQYVSIFKQPDISLLAEVNKKMKDDEVAGAKLLFNGCKLHVDEAVINDISLFLSVAAELKKLTTQKKSESQSL